MNSHPATSRTRQPTMKGRSLTKLRLTEGTEAVKSLRAKFHSGIYPGIFNPKDVWSSDPVYRQYDLDRFRARWNRLKKEYIGNNSTVDHGGIQPINSEENNLSNRRGSVFSLEISDDEFIGDDEEIKEDNDLSHTTKMTFTPVHVISSWMESETLTERVTVSILLPSGVVKGDFAINVVNGGTQLEISVVWPGCLSNPRTMHRKWLRNGQMKSYHPVIEGFDTVLRQSRTRVTDSFTSVCLIELPKTVQSHIHEKYNLQFEDLGNARMVYVHLKADTSKYAQKNDIDDFEAA